MEIRFALRKTALAAAGLASLMLFDGSVHAGGYGPSSSCYCPSGPVVTDSLTDGLTDGQQQLPSDLDLGIQESFAAFTGTSVAVNSAGYIDNAIVGTYYRSRFDAAYNNSKPDRAEFFYPASAQLGGGGLLLPETELDFQEFSSYFELAFTERFSAFIEAPTRLINPEINENDSGFSDLQTGFKYALIPCPDRYVTFQFRVYTPTGDEQAGLGTGHVSLEPAILWYRRMNDRFSLFGEFRDWIPIGGSQDAATGDDFAGNVLRYGIGSGYDIYRCCDTCNDRRLTLVSEVVGWTVLDGLFTDPNTGTAVDASGDTIVNLKVGTRYTLNQNSVYVGYGHAVTGDAWYEDILRLEYRRVF